LAATALSEGLKTAFPVTGATAVARHGAEADNTETTSTRPERIKLIPRVLLPAQIKPLSDAQKERYGSAIGALKRSALGRSPKSFGAALDLAIHHCEKAKAFDWPERHVRTHKRNVADSWGAVNMAATKLAVHFEKLDDCVGSERLDAAIFTSGLQMRSQSKGSLPKGFARLLHALAKQPRPKDCEDQIGPLGLPWSRKLPSREVVLTIVLAHAFNRVASHDADCELWLTLDDVIVGGSSWDVAALFAAAALGQDAIDPTAARKFLSTHADCLIYRGWPNPTSV
jgi:hypothetical protein